ncbi:MAG TPA: YdeI/OmpD-associated family protein [Ferruginibacter sp.]|nr:YdeI/OmpD-associated family protein [Ferruginibacter sp.]
MLSNKKWEKEIALLEAIISKMPMEKCIKWGAEVFTYNGRNVVSYGGFKNYFALWFFNAVFLKDKYKVLINAQEGKTKSLRQWRFFSKAEIDEKKIKEYIMEAIEIVQKGLKVPAEKFKALPVPQLLQDALQKNKKLKANFEKLTPGKQKEYIVFINEAKQEQTRLSRLEKIKPLILLSAGLNDKYK